MGWLSYLVPSIFYPSFTWPHRILGSVPLATEIPPTPTPNPRFIRRLCGFIHVSLLNFSEIYCVCMGVRFDHTMADLPFGLVLKWSDGTRLEEVLATKVARAAGFPVPRIISYGDHPDKPWAPVSILMTRLPGNDLLDVYKKLPEDERKSAASEMRKILETMRAWPNVWGEERICSVTGGPIRSVRVPHHLIGPCESKQEFHNDLISAASPHGFNTKEEFEESMARAKQIHPMPHKVVFGHGDIRHHNIRVYKGHVSLIDWESAGWYPEYWDYTTALRYVPKDFWWYDFVMQIDGSNYLLERECERALISLTVDSYAC